MVIIIDPVLVNPVQRKIEGFVRTMQDQLGLSAQSIEADLVQHSLYTLEGGQAAATALIDRDCTAVVCASDMMALGAIRAARQRGLDVPKGISVVGFDDSPLIAFTDPPLTTIRQPVSAMAIAAVRALIDEVNGHAAPHSEYMFRPELIVRGSTAIAASRTASAPTVKPRRSPRPATVRTVAVAASAPDAVPGPQPPQR